MRDEAGKCGNGPITENASEYGKSSGSYYAASFFWV